jgi:hypothetical protein
MDVTTYDSTADSFSSVSCQLKGSLRHFKCRQRIVAGAYCITDYDDVVTLIFTTDQHPSIPETTFFKLSSVCQDQEPEARAQQDGNSIDFMPVHEFDDYECSSDEDSDIAFEVEAEAEAEAEANYTLTEFVDDIDLI